MLGQPTPEVQAVIADTLARRQSALTRRERAAEVVVGGGFAVAVALIWLLRPPHSISVAQAVICTLVLVVAMRVRIDTPFGFTVPTQLAFVPLLFALPLALVPIAAAIAAVCARLDDVVAGRLRPARLVQTVANAWYAIGPVAVFALARTAPSHAGPALLLAALAMQFIVDFAASGSRFAISRGAGLREQLGDTGSTSSTPRSPGSAWSSPSRCRTRRSPRSRRCPCSAWSPCSRASATSASRASSS